MRDTLAVLFLAHGSRRPEANRFVSARVDRLARRLPGVMVVAAFLGGSAAGPAEALASLVGAGARRIAVVPLFLAPGSHVTRDLPAEVRRLAALHPGVEIVLAPPLGSAEGVWEAAAGLARAALGLGEETGVSPSCG